MRSAFRVLCDSLCRVFRLLESSWRIHRSVICVYIFLYAFILAVHGSTIPVFRWDWHAVPKRNKTLELERSPH